MEVDYKFTVVGKDFNAGLVFKHMKIHKRRQRENVK
jgi:hypothetical protein